MEMIDPCFLPPFPLFYLTPYLRIRGKALALKFHPLYYLYVCLVVNFMKDGDVENGVSVLKKYCHRPHSIQTWNPTPHPLDKVLNNWTPYQRSLTRLW